MAKEKTPRETAIAETPMPRLGWKKKFVFAVVFLVGVLAMAEATLALLGVRPIHVIEDPYVGFKGGSPLFESVSDGGHRYYETAQAKVGLFNR